MPAHADFAGNADDAELAALADREAISDAHFGGVETGRRGSGETRGPAGKMLCRIYRSDEGLAARPRTTSEPAREQRQRTARSSFGLIV